MHGYVMFVLGISESTIDAIHIISYHIMHLAREEEERSKTIGSASPSSQLASNTSPRTPPA